MATDNEPKSQQLSSLAEPNDPQKLEEDGQVSGNKQSLQNDKKEKEQDSNRPQSALAANIGKFGSYFDSELARLERLTLFALQNKVNPAYRQSWTSEANKFYKLAVNFERRLKALTKEERHVPEKSKDKEAS